MFSVNNIIEFNTNETSVRKWKLAQFVDPLVI